MKTEITITDQVEAWVLAVAKGDEFPKVSVHDSWDEAMHCAEDFYGAWNADWLRDFHNGDMILASANGYKMTIIKFTRDVQIFRMKES